MHNLRIGLLPLYLQLYDNSMPEIRSRIDLFYDRIADELSRRGLAVAVVPICRVEAEFAAAIQRFEAEAVTAIVTLHLAYSPSLESATTLAATSLPLLVLDTTPAFSFGPADDPDEIMYNHGIHGVQDLCNLLLRRHKSFQVMAGHWERSDVLDRTVRWVRAVGIVNSLRRSRVGRIGTPFTGMGDFAVPTDVLRNTLGVETVVADVATLCRLLPDDEDPSVAKELELDHAVFDCSGINEHTHRRSVRAGLAVRRWLEQEQLTAFTFNFLCIDTESGLPTVPFLEASKAMSRGIGYAGEGDVLTAALVGALASVYPATTFTEMFCPDWENETVFVSHMGELNPALIAVRPRLVEQPFPFTDVENPAVAVGCLHGGPAVLVNLAPSSEGTFRLILAPVTMCDVSNDSRFAAKVRGWFKPSMPLADFLASFSQAGGTHHSALVYGDVLIEMLQLGELLGVDTVQLK